MAKSDQLGSGRRLGLSVRLSEKDLGVPWVSVKAAVKTVKAGSKPGEGATVYLASRSFFEKTASPSASKFKKNADWIGEFGLDKWKAQLSKSAGEFSDQITKKDPSGTGPKNKNPATWSAALAPDTQIALIGLPRLEGAFMLQEAIRDALRSALTPGARATQKITIDFTRLDHAAPQWLLSVVSWIAYYLGTEGWAYPKPKKTAEKSDEGKSRSKSTSDENTLWELTLQTSHPVFGKAEAQEVVDQALALAQANCRVRTLAALPNNILHPRSYTDLVKQLCKGAGLKFEFIDQKSLEKMGAGAFSAVVQADPQGGNGIVHISYVPQKNKSKKNVKKLILVGKGLCFDTGGYNIKVRPYMQGMHGDMTGSAIALSMALFYANSKADIEVHAYLALAENLISPSAYRPNDVVRTLDGTTIEVVDTDAEGRMVLADTLVLARREKGDLCLDFATLTGSAVRALDTRRSAVFSNRSELLDEAYAAGERSGERVWGFPIGEDYRLHLKSEVADILQCSDSNNSDQIYAATFLSHFIGDETPWVHVDLSACENKGGLGLISSYITGFGVLWTHHFVESFFSNG